MSKIKYVWGVERDKKSSRPTDNRWINIGDVSMITHREREGFIVASKHPYEFPQSLPTEFHKHICDYLGTSIEKPDYVISAIDLNIGSENANYFLSAELPIASNCHYVNPLKELTEEEKAMYKAKEIRRQSLKRIARHNWDSCINPFQKNDPRAESLQYSLKHRGLIEF